MSRQSAVAEPRSPKADICRTRSLQQSAAEARRWNVNAGANNEHLAYQPQSPASQAHVYGRDNLVAAMHVGSELNQSLPVTQPMRAAPVRQTEARYQVAADGDMFPDVSVRPTGPPLSVPSTSYQTSGSPLSRTVAVVQPGVSMSPSSTQQIATSDQQTPLRDSFELPAPPTPPSTSVLTADRLPSPPMMITPPPDTIDHFSALPLPQNLPPPELITGTLLGDDQWHKPGDSSAAVDSTSDSSSLVATQPTDDVSKTEPPLVRDTRSDLLAAIREGITVYLLCPLSCLLCPFNYLVFSSA